MIYSPLLRIFLLTSLLFVFTTAVVAHANTQDKSSKWKIGLALGNSGLNDHGFNDMQIMGMNIAREMFDVSFEQLVPLPGADDPETIMRELIAKGCNVIIAGAWDYLDALDKLAREYPSTKFVILDTKALNYLPNVASVTFRQNEASFLAGALAANVTRTGVIAFIGGDNHPVIKDFLAGFTGGSLHMQKTMGKNCSLETRTIMDVPGVENPWMAEEAAYTLAHELHDKSNADIIFAVAGKSNYGVFKAAKEKGFYAIGVDADQDFLAPGRILTSVMKRLDTAIVYITESLILGTFENRNYSLGLFEHGVSLSPMTYTRALIGRKTFSTLERLKFQIVDGRVKAPSSLTEQSRKAR